MDLDFKSLAQIIQPDGELHFYDFLDLGPEHGAAMVVVALLSLISLCINAHLIFGRVRLRNVHSFTAFDGLILNLLVVNFLLTLLVVPFNLTAMVILDNIWTFGKRYCQISAALSYFLVFVGCWSIPLMAWQFCFSYFLLAVPTCVPKFLHKTINRWYHVTGPPMLLWIIGAAVYCPYAYSTIQLSAGSYPCLAVAENVYPHEGIRYFVAPFLVTLAALLAVYIVHSNTDVPFPRQRSRAAVRQESDESAGRSFPDIRLEVLGNSIPVEVHRQDSEVRTSIDVQVAQQAVKEIQFDHLKICLGLLVSLFVFVGPYAVIQFLPGLNSESHLRAWRVAYTWMCCKVLIEPFLIMACSRKYQQACRFWKHHSIPVRPV